MKMGSDFASDLPIYDDFELGGFLNLSGYRRNELRGQRLGYGALVYYRRLNKSEGLLGMNYYLGGSLEERERGHEVTLGEAREGALLFGA